MTRQRIYVASSWRNKVQPLVVRYLRSEGHDVYDFRDPGTAGGAFGWVEIDLGSDRPWHGWTNADAIEALEHPVARAGFAADWTALTRAQVGVLVGPCGRSAHLELGVMVGRGIPTAILLTDRQEAELMYGMADLVTESLQRLGAWARDHDIWRALPEDGPRDHRGERVASLAELL